jgi:hypothetical protein
MADTLKRVDTDMKRGKDKGIAWPEAKKRLLRNHPKETARKRTRINKRNLRQPQKLS